MNRCKANCVSTGKRCKNNAIHHGHCGVHSRVSMRFKDEFSGEQVSNTTEELKRIGSIYIRKLQMAVEKVNRLEEEPRRRINQRFLALRNKYFIGEFAPNVIENAKFLKGNDAVRFIAKRFHITPAHLVRLCPEIPHIEEITVMQIIYLVNLYFGKDALRMFSQEGVVV